MRGNDGADTLEGGAGIDAAFGGAGADTFLVDATVPPGETDPAFGLIVTDFTYTGPEADVLQVRLGGAQSAADLLVTGDTLTGDAVLNIELSNGDIVELARISGGVANGFDLSNVMVVMP